VARTVDPQRHLARRLVIIDAALTCFAAAGYAGTSTAAICREAGIGSGTFFHYFPTKQSLLLAILALGTEETRAWFAAHADDADPLGVVEAYLDHTAEEMSDPRLAGFVRAVSAVMGEPEPPGDAMPPEIWNQPLHPVETSHQSVTVRPSEPAVNTSRCSGYRATTLMGVRARAVSVVSGPMRLMIT
jgi:hypothetical protein